MRRLTMFALAAALAAGCTTQFYGNATVSGGRGTCDRVCASYGMQLTGIVSMGDHYTDGCVCTVPGATATAAGATAAAAGSVVAAATAQRHTAQQQQAASTR